MQFTDAPRSRGFGRSIRRARVAHAIRRCAAQPKPGLGRRVGRGSIMQSTDAPRSRSLGWADEPVEGRSCSPQMRRAAEALVGPSVGPGSLKQLADAPRGQGLGRSPGWSTAEDAVRKCAARPGLGRSPGWSTASVQPLPAALHSAQLYCAAGFSRPSASRTRTTLARFSTTAFISARLPRRATSARASVRSARTASVSPNCAASSSTIRRRRTPAAMCGRARWIVALELFRVTCLARL
jgi:hypothetical protein